MPNTMPRMMIMASKVAEYEPVASAANGHIFKVIFW